MMRLSPLFCIVFISTFANNIWCFTFTEVPTDTAVLAGRSAQFNCSLTCNNDCTALTWQDRVPSPGGNVVDLYYGDTGTFNIKNPRSDRYTIAPGTTNLRLSSVNKNDAGRYCCKPNQQGGEDDVKIAYLTVIEKSTCRSNGVVVEGGEASVTCSVEFYKPNDFIKTPSVDWIGGISGTSRVGGNEVTNTANFSVTSADNGRSCTCRVYYENAPPQYTDTSCAATINVNYGPKTINITTNSAGGFARILPGEKVTCSASGNPAPGYVWRKVSGAEGFRELSGAELTVDASMQGVYGYMCTASNTLVNNQMKSLTTSVIFAVYVPRTTQPPSTTDRSLSTFTGTTTLPQDSQALSQIRGGDTGGLVAAVVVIYIIVGLIIAAFVYIYLQLRKQIQQTIQDKTYMSLKPTTTQQSRPEAEYSQIAHDQVSGTVAPYAEVYENSHVMTQRHVDHRV